MRIARVSGGLARHKAKVHYLASPADFVHENSLQHPALRDDQRAPTGSSTKHTATPSSHSISVGTAMPFRRQNGIMTR